MKSIIVTGAGTGLGKELAIGFANQGYHIILAGRSLRNLQKVEAAINEHSKSATSFEVDVRSQESVQAFMKNIQHSTLYGLINNAGVGHFGPFENLTTTQLEDMLHTNLYGTINMCQGALPLLKEENEGFIMNIISTAGLKGKKHETGYSASKFAQRGLTESLQKEYEGSGISIKAVYMGGMDTPFWESSDHVKDKSRLRLPRAVAEKIIEKFKENTIILD